MTTITEYDAEIVDYLMDRCDADPETGCWNWSKALFHGTGYGQIGSRRFADRSGKVAAHTMSYWAHFGPYDDGLIVMHKCDNRRCFNPDHLRLGTYRDNSLDMIAKGRGNPATKITPEQVRAIVALMAMPGMNAALLARAVGVSHDYPIKLRNGVRQLPPTIH